MNGTELAAQLRETFPLQDSFGPATTVQRQLIHAAADRLAALEAELAEANDSLARSRRAHDRAVIADGERIERLEAENGRLRDHVARLSKYDPKKVRPAALANDLMELTALAAGGDL